MSAKKRKAREVRIQPQTVWPMNGSKCVVEAWLYFVDDTQFGTAWPLFREVLPPLPKKRKGRKK